MAKTIREKTEQQIVVNFKADIFWMVLLVLVVIGGIFGILRADKAGYERGMQDMRISILEDFQIAETARRENNK